MAASGIHSYPVALYFTIMQITTIGSQYDPITAEGQIICLGISVYACAMLGYLTATLATFFIGRDASDPKAEVAGQKSVDYVQEELTDLREEIRSLKSLVVELTATFSGGRSKVE